MSNAKSIAEHWGTGDFYALITSELSKMGKPLDSVTVMFALGRSRITVSC